MTDYKPIIHFVRFDDMHGRQFQNAKRIFGPPAFMHRLWDRRALRDVAPGDTVVFAKGDSDQPLAPHNGNDDHYWPDVEA